MMILKRKCLICGKEIKIRLNKDKTYSGGNYFGKIKLPLGKGKYFRVGKTNLLGKDIGVVKQNGKEKEVEYWECDKCASEK